MIVVPKSSFEHYTFPSTLHKHSKLHPHSNKLIIYANINNKRHHTLANTVHRIIQCPVHLAFPQIRKPPPSHSPNSNTITPPLNPKPIVENDSISKTPSAVNFTFQ